MDRRIKLVALDLDGTLLNSEKKISERDLAALKALEEAEVLMVPVTGRPAEGLPKAVLEVPGVRYAVTSNGATIRDLETGETRLEKHLEAEKALEVLEASREVDMIREVFREGIGYLSQKDYDTLKERYDGTPMLGYVLGTRRVLPGSVEEHLREDKRPVEELFFLTDGPEEKKGLMETLAGVEGLTFAHPFPKDLEVLAGGIDKGEGFRYLLNHLGIDPAETLAMGDSSSDLPLLEAAGISVAMANGEERVKEAVDFVTASCDENGVALALEKFVLGK